jgi:serine/threonine protein kinase
MLCFLLIAHLFTILQKAFPTRQRIVLPKVMLEVDADLEDFPIESQDSNYRCREVLGKGGSCVVWRATSGQREVAIKFYSKEKSRKQEIDALTNIRKLDKNQEHIIRIEDVGGQVDIKGHTVFYAVFELCHLNLEQFVEEMHSEAWEKLYVDLLAIIRVELLPALKFLHTQKSPIIHGDLKASNVIGKKKGRSGRLTWKLADFDNATTLGRPLTGMTYQPPEVKRALMEYPDEAFGGQYQN